MSKKNPPTESRIFSRDTEQMVLGCMISSQAHFRSAFEKESLSNLDFHYPEHQIIFLALRTLFKDNHPSDIHLVSEQLKRNEKLGKIGGIAYLADLASLPGTSAYFESYVHELKEVSIRREFVYRCEELQGLALSGEKDISSIAAIATEDFGKITKKTVPQKSFSLASLSRGEESISFLDELKDKRIKYAESGQIPIPGISTGYHCLDSDLGGLRDENLILIAARPSVGKTAFALNLVRNLGLIQKLPVAFFSLEMTSKQIFLRLLSSQSGIPASNIERGLITDSEMEQIETAIQQLESSQIFINDCCCQSAKMIAQMRFLIEEHDVQAFFIDYVGLIQPSREREIKAYEIGDITRSLKNFANELRIPIVCLAQLNRQADSSNRPQLSMLKDSGNLEQDADSVIFLHRRDLYDPKDKPDQMEIIIAKNRHGATNTKTFQFKKDTGTISEFTEMKESTLSWEEYNG